MRSWETSANEERARRARRLAEAFLAALAAGDVPRARGLAAPGFSWFGHPAELSAERIRGLALSLVPGGVREVPADVLSAVGGEPFGPLEDGRVAVLADVRRQGAVVTVALVVDLAGGVVERAVDPAAFVAEAQKSARSRRG